MGGWGGGLKVHPLLPIILDNVLVSFVGRFSCY